jgi:hypothetical protein
MEGLNKGGIYGVIGLDYDGAGLWVVNGSIVHVFYHINAGFLDISAAFQGTKTAASGVWLVFYKCLGWLNQRACFLLFFFLSGVYHAFENCNAQETPPSVSRYSIVVSINLERKGGIIMLIMGQQSSLCCATYIQNATVQNMWSRTFN